ncbi:MAG TPA: glycosyltransferase family 4 protein [Thermoplasmata archaeon]|nr:glycosyltransferase family 4 protein [Thermoplasmata archaeon]
MRIAQLSTRFPPAPGGVERHVAQISQRLQRRGHSVQAFTSFLNREFPWEPLPQDFREPSHEGVVVQRLRSWSLPGEFHYVFFRGMAHALRNFSPEVMHVHTYGTNQAAVARRVHRKFGTPWVLTAHYHPIWSIEGGWLRHRIRGFYDRVLAGGVVQDAARIIVQSREEERLLRAPGLDLPPVSILPPGYSPLPGAGDSGEAFAKRFGVEGPFVLFVGRLASNKGLLTLVESFQALARHDPKASLVIVGADGGQRNRVETELRNRGLSSRAILTGYLHDERLLAAAFREARLFVLPSEYEAFGLVLLEALAQGTAVVASRVGGIPEVIEDGKAGRLVPPLEAEPLAQAMIELWDNHTLREEMGAYGRTVLVPRYSWDRLVEQLETVYREVLAH